MSFLYIMLFASAFYFAQARPDWLTVWGVAQTARDSIPVVSQLPSVPYIDSSAYEQHLNGFMQEMSNAVDQYMTPLMSQLDVTKQEELKTLGLNGFASYVNYLLLLIHDYENGKSDDEDFHGGSRVNEDEMIFEFESLPHLDSPYIAKIPVEE